jgi:hypothetical protein
VPKQYSAVSGSIDTRRRQSRNQPQAEPLEMRTHLSVSQDPSGWTVITPEHDSRVIYVSSSSGNDKNNGRSPEKAVKSVSQAESMLRDHSGDQMLLKRGDSWNEALGGWSKAGRSASEPIVIGAYGAGARPLLKTGTNDGFYIGTESGIDHVAIMGLGFVAHTRLPGPSFTGSGEAIGLRVLGESDDLLVEDCFIQGYGNNITLQNFFGTISNVRVRRSVIVDAYAIAGVAHSQGIYAGHLRRGRRRVAARGKRLRPQWS